MIFSNMVSVHGRTYLVLKKDSNTPLRTHSIIQTVGIVRIMIYDEYADVVCVYSIHLGHYICAFAFAY